jgi:hypothetical protein
MTERTRLRLSVGNWLELAAAGLAVYGVDALAGWRWSLLAGAAACAVFAELLYDETVLRIPLPHLPRRHRKNVNGLKVQPNRYEDE